MNDLMAIPCVLMRGGTSKGPFFLSNDLPGDIAARDEVLLAAMGSGHPLQIDGVGGSNPVTSKVAIVSPSDRSDADVEYLFAQVSVLERRVDTSPNCGNMLAAVGPFAIEAGLMRASSPLTVVRIYNVNTNTLIEAEVQTPNGRVSYQGDASIDGVPGNAAPVSLTFLDASNPDTGNLFPTGAKLDEIGGVSVTCINAAMPMVLLLAADVGATGYETAAEINQNMDLLARIESIRLAAGERMGLGDVANRVIPKPVLLAQPRSGGDLSVRYLMPHTCHPALASTGAVGIATASLHEGTLVSGLQGVKNPPATVSIEHPSGKIEVRFSFRNGIAVAGILRTARRLFEGRILVPSEPYARSLVHVA